MAWGCQAVVRPTTLTTIRTTTKSNRTKSHAKWFYVAPQVNVPPQPVQKMTLDGCG